MITQSADGRGRRAPYGGRGRGRSDAAGRGRGQRQHVSNGEGRVSFGQQWLEPSLGHPGQPAFNDGHPPGFASEPGKATQGAIVALLDSYGFIRSVSIPVSKQSEQCSGLSCVVQVSNVMQATGRTSPDLLPRQ